MVRRVNRSETVALALVVLVLLAELGTSLALHTDEMTADWLVPGAFAEYGADDIAWLLLANDTTSQGTLTRNNESRMVFLGQPSGAVFRWNCLSREQNSAVLNLSLQFPLPLGGVSAEVQVDLSSRSMSLGGKALGQVPFWTQASLQSGQTFGIGASPEALAATADYTGSSVDTIQGFQVHFYARVKGGLPFDYDWDTGVLLVILLEPYAGLEPEQLSRCLEPFHSVGLHGCNSLFHLTATNIDLGPPVLDPEVAIRLLQSFLGVLCVAVFIAVCFGFSVLHRRRRSHRRIIRIKRRH
jgi:hypothetical protein